MKKYEDLHLPLMDPDLETIQQAHCDSSMVCIDGDCEECLFCSANLDQFTRWYFNGAYKSHETMPEKEKQSILKIGTYNKSAFMLDKNFHVYVHGKTEMLDAEKDEKGKYLKLYFNEIK